VEGEGVSERSSPVWSLARASAYALWFCFAACDADRAGVIAPVDAEVRAVVPAPSAVESPPTFPIAATLDGVSIEEATAYVDVTIDGSGRSQVVGLDVLSTRTAGCDDRSKWVTKHGAALLARDGDVWTARLYAPDPEELPCPGGVDRAFDLGGGYVHVRLDANEHALVPGTIAEGSLELETGKGAAPAAKLSARFVARVCLADP
jgi:hypothetical protein